MIENPVKNLFLTFKFGEMFNQTFSQNPEKSKFRTHKIPTRNPVKLKFSGEKFEFHETMNKIPSNKVQ